jgi:hypothetical protein
MIYRRTWRSEEDINRDTDIFDNITLLIIRFNFKNKLPPNLLELDCSYCGLTSLPDLPKTLKKLNCSYNELTNLPDILPPDLTDLSCDHNRLTCVPTILPKNLDYFNCSDNDLSRISNLPDKLALLNCSNNKITDLVLNHNLVYLFCSNNLITGPIVISDKLKTLKCENNPFDFFLEIFYGVTDDDFIEVTFDRYKYRIFELQNRLLRGTYEDFNEMYQKLKTEILAFGLSIDL